VISRALALILALAIAAGCEPADPVPEPDAAAAETRGLQNFIFFNRDRERISEPGFLENEGVAGAHLKYTWRELEPERDRYELGPILADLAYLEGQGKRLFIQLQEVSFDERINVPDYLVEDPEFSGGVARQYEWERSDDSDATFDGWVPRRWDPAVRERFARLLEALGRELDHKIEGINLPETAVGFGESGALYPEGYTPEGYFEGIKALMTSARGAFPHSKVIVYANFMPGEALPEEDRGFLRGVYEHAEASGVGVGGPDLLPHRRGQQTHSLPLIRARAPGVTAGLAVQWGNLEDVNPSTGAPVKVSELYLFARDSLRLDYIFWGVQEPYYSDDVLPFLEALPSDSL
jgi:hypothetical protein